MDAHDFLTRAAKSDVPGALDALISVATDEKADVTVRRAAGEYLAQLMIRRGQLGSSEYDILPFHELTAEADEAYDRTVARHLRAARAD